MSPVPPPPGPPIPEPPSFGWIGDPRHLTVNEMLEIARHLGDNLENLQGPHLMPFAAVAYARREDPEKYPWEIAGNMPVLMLQQLTAEEEERQEQEEEAHARAVEDAIEQGQAPPDPS